MRALQIFNRYLEYGGEEGSVERIAQKLDTQIELETFYASTEDFIKTPFDKFRMPMRMMRNPQILDNLRELQRLRQFDFWQIHNVFPAISVATYELATELNVPVIQYLHNYRFGCLNATYFREGKICRDCSPLKSLPGIAHGCWRGSSIASAAMATALRRTWSRGSIDRIRGFIALSESQKSEHVAMGIPSHKVTVIPHFLHAGEQPESLANPNGHVLYIGRITEEKGVELLLRSWAGVNNRGRMLRIVGDGPKMCEMQSLAKKLRLTDVIFEGFVPKEKHLSLWEDCSFFVAPSQWLEPFGMVVLEAWRHARPVLATNLGSFPEMITNDHDGWLADPTIEGLTQTLQKALDSGNSVIELGENGRSSLKKRFNPELWSEKMLELYKALKI